MEPDTDLRAEVEKLKAEVEKLKSKQHTMEKAWDIFGVPILVAVILTTMGAGIGVALVTLAMKLS